MRKPSVLKKQLNSLKSLDYPVLNVVSLLRVKQLKMCDMKNLNLNEFSFPVDSSSFVGTFEFVAERFLISLNANSIRGFISTRGNCECSILATSIFDYFVNNFRKKSFILPYERIGQEKELHYFVVYRISGAFIMHFRNNYDEFVNVTFYNNGCFSVHFLR